MVGPITDPNNINLCLVVFPAYPNAASGAYLIARDTSSFGYDAFGNMITADNSKGLVHRQYYRNGAVKLDSLAVRPPGFLLYSFVYGLRSHYNLAGRRDSLHFPGGTAVANTYRTDDGALLTVSDPQGNTYRHVYDVVGRVDSLVTNANSVREKRWYDADGRQYQRERTAATVGLVSRENLVFDAQGRVTRAG